MMKEVMTVHIWNMMIITMIFGMIITDDMVDTIITMMIM